MSATSPDVTKLLIAWGQGDNAALDRLIPIVHDELHRIARGPGKTVRISLANDNLFSPTFASPTTFVEPRRAMLSMRLNLGR